MVTDEESFDKCSVCFREIVDDEVFFMCEKERTAFCWECRLSPPCHKIPSSIIPKPTQDAERCIHRKILGKSKLKEEDGK